MQSLIRLTILMRLFLFIPLIPLTVASEYMAAQLKVRSASKSKIPPSASDIYENALPSVMTLIVTRSDGSGGLGTGFMAIKNGLAITAWHVIDGASKVTARFSDGKEFEVIGIIDKDSKLDLAIVRVKVSGRPLLSLNIENPKIGAKAYVIGAPRGLEFSISDGLISQIRAIEGTQGFQFTCPASPGNSGGPLFDGQGNVLGVVSWQARDGQNLNFAVPVKFVSVLNSSLPVTFWKKSEKARITPPEKAFKPTNPKNRPPSDEPVRWEHDYQVALKRAKAEKKVIFMDLWTEWCGPCQHLQKNIFPSAEGQAALAKVVAFSALVEKKDRTPMPEGTKLAGLFNLTAFPTMVILDADGKELRRQVGAFRNGAEFASWLGAK